MYACMYCTVLQWNGMYVCMDVCMQKDASARARNRARKDLKGRLCAHLMLLSHDFAEDCSKIIELI